MSTETLQRVMPQRKEAPQSVVTGAIAFSTLAIATLASPLLSIDTPTYIPNVPSELINSFFAPEYPNINMQKLIYSIRSYSTFENNWDGYDGKPPSDEAIKDTLNFLKYLPTDIAIPYAGLSGDGEINLFWDNEGVFIDIGFTGENRYSYYARNSEGKEFFGNYIAISSNLPLDLINLIKTIRT